MSEETPKYETKQDDIEKFESRSGSMPVPVDMNPTALLSTLIQKGADLATLEKFMELSERYESNQARKAYVVAMNNFKANPPEIEKDKKVEYQTSKGTTKYSHASLANVTNKINKALSNCGLSAAWNTAQSEKGVTVTCTITHENGHSESTSLSAPPDISGSKSAIQAIGSTISYLERYTILALTGLATHDQDDDGKGAEIEYINEKQLSSIVDTINAKGIDEAKFLKYMGVESSDKIPFKEFGRAMSALKKAKGREPGADDS